MTNAFTHKTDSISIATMWGANPTEWKQFPQFVANRGTARAMSGYLASAYDASCKDVRFAPIQVRLEFTNRANNEDVETAAAELGLDVDWGEESHAYMVASDKKLREHLASEGYDAYADYCFFENLEPLQIVVFNKSQVTVL